jgi:hypothetical protein
VPSNQYPLIPARLEAIIAAIRIGTAIDPISVRLCTWATQLWLRAQVLGDVLDDVLDRPDATTFTVIARRIAALIDHGA